VTTARNKTFGDPSPYDYLRPTGYTNNVEEKEEVDELDWKPDANLDDSFQVLKDIYIVSFCLLANKYFLLLFFHFILPRY
jgi:hypothetical protein